MQREGPGNKSGTAEDVYYAFAIPVFNGLRNLINGVKTTLNDSGIFEIWQRILNMASKLATGGIAKATKLLTEDFKGAANISRGLTNILYSIAKVVVTIKSAFDKAFGKTEGGGVGQTVTSLAESFELLTQKLIPSEETLQKLAIVMYKVFSVVRTVGSAISSFVTTYWDWIKAILGVIAAYVALRKAMGIISIMKTWNLTAIAIGAAILGLVKAIQFLVANWDNLKSRLTGSFPILTTLSDKFDTLATFIEKYFNIAVENAAKYIAKIWSSLKTFRLDTVKVQFNNVKSAVVEFINKMREIPIIGKFVDNLKIASFWI